MAYTDEQKAMFLLQLEAAGWPNNEHAPVMVSKQKGAPHARTLKRWWKIRHAPHIDRKVQQKKPELKEAIRDLLHLHIAAASDAVVGNEDLRALDTGIGILVDKLRLLEDKPTGIVKIVELLQDGRIQPDTVRQRWPSMADELFSQAGIKADAD